ncbi:MAG: pentapeptide repeat-containing protein, partial [Flavobacteriales bacterium]|nr:pentapeptide repeat-containing protein [Flavobacteriales bacterium]
LSGAVFEHCDLQKADFRTAQNFIFDLNRNKVKGAKFSRENLMGLLIHYNIEIE